MMRGALRKFSISRSPDLAVLILVGLCFAFYVAFALSPSSYQVGLRFLGVETKPLLGIARPIRSDEWIVYTPLIQIAVRSGFSTVDLVSPYQESLKGFIAFPILDWSLIFKPQLWAYWVLPPAYAYSLYFALMWSSFLLGYFVLLRQMNVPTWVAFFGSLAFLASHFVQVWWTSNAPAFALAPWPAVIFLLRLAPVPKALLLSWATAVWAFGLVYPPFQIPTAFALLVLLLAFRRDAFTLSNILAAAVAAMIVGAAFYFYFSELIGVMKDTVYPGQRNSDGGTVPYIMALANVLPFITTANFIPLLPASNECEIAAVSTLIPLMILIFAKYETAVSRLAEVRLGLVIALAGLVLMAAWLLLPIPSTVGRWLLWNYVPPVRMLFAFGLLLTLFFVVVGARLEYEITLKRAGIFVLTLILAYLFSKNVLSADTSIKIPNVFPWIRFEWVAIAIVVAMVAMTRWHVLAHLDRRIQVFGAAALVGMVTFGTFNPFQPAHPIFNIPKSALQRDFEARARQNPNGWLVVPGMYGALLNGAGISSINHTLLTPQLAFFRRIFPDMPPEQFNSVFNRYSHIIPKAEDEVPHSPQGDVVMVPIAPFEAKSGNMLVRP